MPKQREETRRLGVPPLTESYQEMKGSKRSEGEVEKRERVKVDKVYQHLAHEKKIGYERHLPPIEKRISEDRPPFKKK